MPPFVIPPLVKFAVGALGVGVIVRSVMKEIRRMNDELDRVKAASIIEPAAREEFPTLRRDPRTGDWRVTEKGGRPPNSPL
jgi:hypothetical protein